MSAVISSSEEMFNLAVKWSRSGIASSRETMSFIFDGEKIKVSALCSALILEAYLIRGSVTLSDEIAVYFCVIFLFVSALRDVREMTHF